MKNICGALIQRGIVASVDEDGRCRIASIDQPGITTLPLAVMQGAAAQEGNTVLYCEFADGDGAVLMVLR